MFEKSGKHHNQSSMNLFRLVKLFYKMFKVKWLIQKKVFIMHHSDLSMKELGYPGICLPRLGVFIQLSNTLKIRQNLMNNVKEFANK